MSAIALCIKIENEKFMPKKVPLAPKSSCDEFSWPIILTINTDIQISFDSYEESEVYSPYKENGEVCWPDIKIEN